MSEYSLDLMTANQLEKQKKYGVIAQKDAIEKYNNDGFCLTDIEDVRKNFDPREIEVTTLEITGLYSILYYY